MSSTQVLLNWQDSLLNLVSEWQGRELVKSAAYPQLCKKRLSPTGE